MRNFKYWNPYLILGVIILFSNKFIAFSEVLIKWLVLILGLAFSVYGLVLFFKEKRKDNLK